MNQPQTTHNNALDQSGHHTYRHKDTQSTAPTDCRNALLYIPICGLLFLATVEYVLLTKAALFITIAAICVAIPWLVTLYGWMLNGTDWIASRLLYRQRPNDIIFTDDSLLPRITILLPVHDEANMLPQICNMLQTLDYPADRLDCMVLIARLLSGPLHASAFAIAFISPQYRFETLSNSNLSLMVAAFYGAWLVLLYAHTPARLGWKRVFLTLTHPFYWLLTVLPLINACKRMALGQLAWLKSTHLPYEAPLEGDEKTHQL